MGGAFRRDVPLARAMNTISWSVVCSHAHAPLARSAFNCLQTSDTNPSEPRPSRSTLRSTFALRTQPVSVVTASCTEQSIFILRERSPRPPPWPRPRLRPLPFPPRPSTPPPFLPPPIRPPPLPFSITVSVSTCSIRTFAPCKHAILSSTCCKATLHTLLASPPPSDVVTTPCTKTAVPLVTRSRGCKTPLLGSCARHLTSPSGPALEKQGITTRRSNCTPINFKSGASTREVWADGGEKLTSVPPRRMSSLPGAQNSNGGSAACKMRLTAPGVIASANSVAGSG
mmetsp:Transcript_27298/g.45512  ORF Transcript_27298/g.45512 Transcript_27298/m.45512 type:complete len:285 (-) Transcript_27298:508-1362(-)